ncbi:MAG TPA: sulfatase [Luteolibacter sp.]|nr:sulfatase [Luteolibacter sp.]
MKILAFILLSLLPLSAAPRNIVLIVTDDQSPDLGCYGNTAIQTPAFDALAADATRFTNAFATTASCSPSRAVILSGLHNHTNGQYGLAHGPHKAAAYPNIAAVSLPNQLRQLGYRTAVAGKYHVAPRSAFDFETFINGGKNTVKLSNDAADFINADPSKPFFLYYCTTDPHRSGGFDESSPLRPNLFGNLSDKKSYPGIDEVIYDPTKVVVPPFLPDIPSARAEIAQYYQSITRVDRGVARLFEHLKKANLWDETLIVFTSDHGMAFAGAKTNVYDSGLRVPFLVRNPYETKRGITSDAVITHADITPSLLDFAQGYDPEKQAPKKLAPVPPVPNQENAGPKFARYHGRSWLPILSQSSSAEWKNSTASHTYHESTMYYPMRSVREGKYKLILNIANGLPFPFASDLWEAPSWQECLKQGPETPYGGRTVDSYLNRPRFELYDTEADPWEFNNLAGKPEHRETLESLKLSLKQFQDKTNDPWLLKWERE